MRVSQLLGTTLRQVADHDGWPSYGMLLRAGYIRPAFSGQYVWLPLAKRALDRISQIFIDQLHLQNGQPIQLPHFLPADLSTNRGRYDEVPGFGFSRSGRSYALHANLDGLLIQTATQEISSYRQIPVTIYQLTWESLDTQSGGGFAMPWESPVLRVWQLAPDEETGLDMYEAVWDEWMNLLLSWGLQLEEACSDPGVWGGRRAIQGFLEHEQGPSEWIEGPNGWQDPLVHQSIFPQTGPENPATRTRIHTPGVSTIAELAAFMKVEESQIAKAVCFVGVHTHSGQDQLIMVMVRGDLEVNEQSIRKAANLHALRPATAAEIQSCGAVAGFASPVGVDHAKVQVLVDLSIDQGTGWIAGANEVDYHWEGVCFGKDFEADLTGSFSKPDPSNGIWTKGLKLLEGKALGTKFSEAWEGTYMSADGKPKPVWVNSFEINLGSVFAGLAESHLEEDGFSFPFSVAPFDVVIVSLEDGEPTHEAAKNIYQSLISAGISVLWDDRHKKSASPGVKFKDAELRGIPLRLTISKKTLAEEEVEWKWRNSGEKYRIPVSSVIDEVLGLLGEVEE
ncbi:YbaK/EbsC family protein [Pontibacter sp. G13]|uniref:proline--tRNA ligase n=1 Tax=Pontibacter sp. G13 TaxID=3074898 RepID=UPI00288A9C0D|nr:YbaK/EbsC family protein [Pontibacter sp. G13]WNJ15944.1 YbaK/EbsC family protein [Pontibacter sp. G13]